MIATLPFTEERMSSEVVFKDFKTTLFMQGSVCHSTTFILSCYSHSHCSNLFPTFPLPELRSVQALRTVYSKITFAGSTFNLYNHFLFFLEHLNNSFEACLSCAIGVAWNYPVDYQTSQTGSRTPKRSQIELYVTTANGSQP